MASRGEKTEAPWTGWTLYWRAARDLLPFVAFFAIPLAGLRLWEVKERGVFARVTQEKPGLARVEYEVAGTRYDRWLADAPGLDAGTVVRLHYLGDPGEAQWVPGKSRRPYTPEANRLTLFRFLALGLIAAVTAGALMRFCWGAYATRPVALAALLERANQSGQAWLNGGRDSSGFAQRLRGSWKNAEAKFRDGKVEGWRAVAVCAGGSLAVLALILGPALYFRLDVPKMNLAAANRYLQAVQRKDIQEATRHVEDADRFDFMTLAPRWDLKSYEVLGATGRGARYRHTSLFDGVDVSGEVEIEIMAFGDDVFFIKQNGLPQAIREAAKKSQPLASMRKEE